MGLENCLWYRVQFDQQHDRYELLTPDRHLSLPAIQVCSLPLGRLLLVPQVLLQEGSARTRLWREHLSL